MAYNLLIANYLVRFDSSNDFFKVLLLSYAFEFGAQIILF